MASVVEENQQVEGGEETGKSKTSMESLCISDKDDSHVKSKKVALYCNPLTICWKTFIQTTTIRGAKNIVANSHIGLRIFWFLFISFSFALVVTVGSYCILAYAKFQTVVRTTDRSVYGADFPVITLCSNGVFSNNPGILEFANHPISYEQLLMKSIAKAIKKSNIENIGYLTRLRTMTQYNVNNIDIVKEMVEDELAMDTYRQFGVATVNMTEYECQVGETQKDCNAKQFWNLKYRNCISFQVPDTLAKSLVDQVYIKTYLMSLEDPFILPGITEREAIQLGGRNIHVFLHAPNTLPKEQPDFLISMTSDRRVLIDVDITEQKRISTPRVACVKAPLNISHAGMPIAFTTKVGDDFELRKLIREKCNCEAVIPPFDVWPLNGSHFCGYLKLGLDQAFEELNCSQNLFKDRQRDSHHKLCYELSYHARMNEEKFRIDSLNRIRRELSLLTYIDLAFKYCIKKGNREACKKIIGVIGILKYGPNSPVFRPRTKKGPKEYLKRAFPKNVSFIDMNRLSEKMNKTNLFISLRCPSLSVSVQEETLVRSLWTTLAQVGGASSFLAGFTFGVIAEIVDTIYKTYKVVRRS